jgi:hypothetical protein
MLLTKKVYDFLKLIYRLLPMSAAVYFLISLAFDTPCSQQVIAIKIILTIMLALGAILRASKRTYIRSGAGTDGTLQIDLSNPEKDIYRLVLNDEVADLSKKKIVTFKVDNNVNLSQK